MLQLIPIVFMHIGGLNMKALIRFANNGLDLNGFRCNGTKEIKENGYNMFVPL